jgi:hypothetical protein
MVGELQAGTGFGRDLQVHILALRGCEEGANGKHDFLKHVATPCELASGRLLPASAPKPRELLCWRQGCLLARRLAGITLPSSWPFPDFRLAGVIYAFEDFVLDTERRELRRATGSSMLSRRFSIC